jgi:hypothetical protein
MCVLQDCGGSISQWDESPFGDDEGYDTNPYAPPPPTHYPMFNIGGGGGHDGGGAAVMLAAVPPHCQVHHRRSQFIATKSKLIAELINTR